MQKYVNESFTLFQVFLIHQFTKYNRHCIPKTTQQSTFNQESKYIHKTQKEQDKKHHVSDLTKFKVVHQ